MLSSFRSVQILELSFYSINTVLQSFLLKILVAEWPVQIYLYVFYFCCFITLCLYFNVNRSKDKYLNRFISSRESYSRIVKIQIHYRNQKRWQKAFIDLINWRSISTNIRFSLRAIVLFLMIKPRRSFIKPAHF